MAIPGKFSNSGCSHTMPSRGTTMQLSGVGHYTLCCQQKTVMPDHGADKAVTQQHPGSLVLEKNAPIVITGLLHVCFREIQGAIYKELASRPEFIHFPNA